MSKENTWVDFRAVKEAVTMQMALDHYGITWLRKKGDEFRGRCPIHKGEGTDTFHASLTKNVFQCFSCKARGNVLDFVAAMEQSTVRDAALKLKDWFRIEMPDDSTGTGAKPDRQPKRAMEKEVGESDENKSLKFQLSGIDSSHPYLASRGLKKETAERFGVGFFAGKGSMAGRIVIPIHNAKGELVAYAGRAINNSEPKYKLPAGFHKAQELFNFHRVLKEAESERPIVLVEGFFDCMKVDQAGFPALAMMGCSLSAAQEQMLVSEFERVIILLDADEAGRTGAADCLLRLGRKLWVKAVNVPDGKQPDQLSSEELHELLMTEYER